MTIQQLLAAGHIRVRRPIWAFPDDYLLLDAKTGFGHLYSPVQLELGYDRPQTVPFQDDGGDEWEAYTGEPAPDERSIA